jgi:hypothetical protein
VDLNLKKIWDFNPGICLAKAPSDLGTLFVPRPEGRGKVLNIAGSNVWSSEKRLTKDSNHESNPHMVVYSWMSLLRSIQ